MWTTVFVLSRHFGGVVKQIDFSPECAGSSECGRELEILSLCWGTSNICAREVGATCLPSSSSSSSSSFSFCSLHRRCLRLRSISWERICSHTWHLSTKPIPIPSGLYSALCTCLLFAHFLLGWDDFENDNIFLQSQLTFVNRGNLLTTWPYFAYVLVFSKLFAKSFFSISTLDMDEMDIIFMCWHI